MVQLLTVVEGKVGRLSSVMTGWVRMELMVLLRCVVMIGSVRSVVVVMCWVRR